MARLVTAIVLAAAASAAAQLESAFARDDSSELRRDSAEAASGREGEPGEPAELRKDHPRSPALGLRLWRVAPRRIQLRVEPRLPSRRTAPLADHQGLTFADIRTDADIILTLDDPELFNYPIALMWEPGFWNLTDSEAESFRAYLLKGGFAIFEDFDGAEQWSTFEAQMRRVLPDGRLVRLEKTHADFRFVLPHQRHRCHPASDVWSSVRATTASSRATMRRGG